MKYIDSYKVAMITIVYDILQEGAQSIATFHGRQKGLSARLAPQCGRHGRDGGHGYGGDGDCGGHGGYGGHLNDLPGISSPPVSPERSRNPGGCRG